MTDYIERYLAETEEIARLISREDIALMAEILRETKEANGRLFILGVGGSAANASHACNDFRKIAGIETYAPTDNVAELTAWTNDVGWDVVFSEWLKTGNLNEKDVILVFSVGGGSDNTSKNLVLAMRYARNVGAKILAVVSRDGGESKRMADACVLVPIVCEQRITPHAEGWQAIVWHLVVNSLAAGD